MQIASAYAKVFGLVAKFRHNFIPRKRLIFVLSSAFEQAFLPARIQISSIKPNYLIHIFCADTWYLQFINENQRSSKPVISSIPLLCASVALAA
jgi:hypothetical protein